MLLPSPPLPTPLRNVGANKTAFINGSINFWTAKHGINCNSSLHSPTPAVYKFTQRPYA